MTAATRRPTRIGGHHCPDCGDRPMTAATRQPARIGAHHCPDRGDRPMTAATRLPTAAAVERRHARELGGAGARR
jgi:hypothetical protein